MAVGVVLFFYKHPLKLMQRNAFSNAVFSINKSFIQRHPFFIIIFFSSYYCCMYVRYIVLYCIVRIRKCNSVENLAARREIFLWHFSRFFLYFTLLRL